MNVVSLLNPRAVGAVSGELGSMSVGAREAGVGATGGPVFPSTTRTVRVQGVYVQKVVQPKVTAISGSVRAVHRLIDTSIESSQLIGGVNKQEIKNRQRKHTMSTCVHTTNLDTDMNARRYD